LSAKKGNFTHSRLKFLPEPDYYFDPCSQALTFSPLIGVYLFSVEDRNQNPVSAIFHLSLQHPYWFLLYIGSVQFLVETRHVCF